MDEGEGTNSGGEQLAQSRRLWLFLWTVIAASLWAQWLGPGAAAELQSEDGSALVLALQILPLATGVVAAMWRHPAALLALFPISFLPGLALLPQAEWQALSSLGAVLSSLATFGLYLLVSASVPADTSPSSDRDQRAIEGASKDRHGDAFRRFVVLRFGAVAVLFAIITYALFFSPDLQQAFAALETEKAARTQHVFAVVTMYFAWMIAVYVAAVLPSLNWEFRRRRSAIPPKQRALLDAPKPLKRRVAIWLVSLLVVVFLSVFFLT